MSCASCLNVISRERLAESFADDLNTRRGIVSGRVALLPRSVEIQPLVASIRPSSSNYPIRAAKRGGLITRTGRREPSQMRFTKRRENDERGDRVREKHNGFVHRVVHNRTQGAGGAKGRSLGPPV